MKKTLRYGLLVLLSCAGLAWAQDSDLSADITVWSWDIAAEALEALVPGFNELYPNVSVTVRDLGNDPTFERGLAGCAAGGIDMPDVYSVENNEAEIFWARFPDCFVDLVSLGADDMRADFPDFKWTELTVGDSVFAMPWDAGPVVMFYRRDLYEQAGIDADSIETWADFIAAGEAMLEATDGQVRMGTIAQGDDDEWFRMLANQAGCFYFDDEGTSVTINQPGCVLALETIAALMEAGVLAVGGWNEQIQLFQASRTATAMFGAWYEGTIRTNAPDQEGLWGVFPMPAFEAGGVRAANLGGSALAIPSSSTNQEAAWAFVSYALGTAEGQVTMLESFGLVPSFLPALDDPFIAEPQAFWGDQAIWETVLSTLADVPQARGTQFFQEARDIMIRTQSNFLAGQFDSAQAALDAAAQQISNATGLPIAD